MDSNCLMCHDAVRHCYGILYGKRVCPSCYRKGECLLLWLESAGLLPKEHEACEQPTYEYEKDLDTDSSSYDSEPDLPELTATA
jgi:hypothetical protein